MATEAYLACLSRKASTASEKCSTELLYLRISMEEMGMITPGTRTPYMMNVYIFICQK